MYVTASSVPPNVPSGSKVNININVHNNTNSTHTGSIWYQFPSNVTNISTTTQGCTVHGSDNTVYCQDITVNSGGTDNIVVTETAPVVQQSTNIRGHVYFQDNSQDVNVYNGCQNVDTDVNPNTTTPLADPLVLAGVAAIGGAGALVMRRRRQTVRA
jgi:hypothetical protein